MERPAFTFVELLIALTLFSFGMLSVLQIFPVSRRLLTQSLMQTQASFLAQEQLELVRTVPYDSLTTGAFEPLATLPGPAVDPATQFQRRTDVQYLDTNYAASGADTGLKKVAVTISWFERAVQRSYTLTSFVASR